MVLVLPFRFRCSIFLCSVQFKVKSPFAVCHLDKSNFSSRSNLRSPFGRVQFSFLLSQCSSVNFFQSKPVFTPRNLLSFACTSSDTRTMDTKSLENFPFCCIFMLLLLFLGTKTYVDLIFEVLWFFSIRCHHCRIILS